MKQSTKVTKRCEFSNALDMSLWQSDKVKTYYGCDAEEGSDRKLMITKQNCQTQKIKFFLSLCFSTW